MNDRSFCRIIYFPNKSKHGETIPGIITAVLVDYRVKSMKDFIEKLYSESRSAGFDIEWAGYTHGKAGDDDRTFMCGDEPVYFSAPKYDLMMENLEIRKSREFRILMIEEGYSAETSKMSILHCIADVPSAMKLMEEASNAALYGKIIGIPINRIKESDVEDAVYYAGKVVRAAGVIGKFRIKL